MTRPTYAELVAALLKVKSNGTRLRHDTRALVDALLAAVDPVEQQQDKLAARDRRDAAIVAQRIDEGLTYKRLGEIHGLSVEHVRGIVAYHDRVVRWAVEKQRMLDQATTIEAVPLAALDLPVRVYGILTAVYDCKTVGDAMRLSDDKLLANPNFGMFSLHAWQQCLRELQKSWSHGE